MSHKNYQKEANDAKKVKFNEKGKILINLEL